MFTDLRRLRALEAVAARRSFSAAATDLGYTQPAVSQQVVALEREVGLTLVERGVRPVKLTEAGERLLELAAPAFAHLATASAELDALRELRGGRLRVAGFASAFSTFLPRALASFAGAHPGVEVGLSECEPREALRLLRSAQVDLAVVYEWPEPERGATEGLELSILGEDLVRVVLPAGHPLARRRELSIGALGRDPWIVPRADGPAGAYRATLERAWAEASIAPAVAFETDDPSSAQALVAAGLGVALVNELILSVPHPGVAIRPLSERMVLRTIAVATVAGRGWPPAAELRRLLEAGGL